MTDRDLWPRDLAGNPLSVISEKERSELARLERERIAALTPEERLAEARAILGRLRSQS